ncbi:23S rRNA (uracil(747)-C(5))-methyltransferase RlmC [Mesocricetibacter intestinalis]|nr:23S rRNA (uracil(747)-C(5))-methyltransferase RlmC [Mesocricetibacter intestinalis]
MIDCPYYQRNQCRSCQWLEIPYQQQLAQKEKHLSDCLQGLERNAYRYPPSPSAPRAFRNKAKMVIGGTVERPLLGILLSQEEGQQVRDLTACPLYPPAFRHCFPVLKDFIARAGLTPYNIERRKGELKYILLTESRYRQEIMLRFVLRSETKLALIRRELPALLQKLPQVKVVSLNIQPQHAAILEGEKEIFLTEQQVLEERFNRIPLFIRPQGFFQTNPEVAQALYATASQWVEALPIRHLWDLFCGVGGFGLHCAEALNRRQPKQPVRLTGIEISPSAIFSAALSTRRLGLDKGNGEVSFQSLDAAAFALDRNEAPPELVIVNPPRRGIGKPLAQFLNRMPARFILYSSCNASSMGQDLSELSAYRIQKIQLFDMFPHTAHYEVLTLLERHQA